MSHGPLQLGDQGASGRASTFLAAFLLLSLFYLMTAPPNHSLSGDSYLLARIIKFERITDVEHPRLFLWIMAMQVLYASASLVITDPDPFHLIGFANAVQAALAVVLFVRMLTRDLSVDARSAWLAAGLLASSYGIWRYGTEVEVYASAALLCVLLLRAAFAVVEVRTTQRTRWMLPLAVFGGIATLVYQPIGWLAGFAIPFYLLIAIGLRHAVLYCGSAGTIVIAGLWIAAQLAVETMDADEVAFILDADSVRPALPDVLTPLKMVYSLGHALLSTNWVLAFEPVQALFTRIAPHRSYAIEIYAAEHAGPVVWLTAVTLPVAAVLLATILWTSLRRPTDVTFCAREATIAVWLALHSIMMVLLAPGGFEAWIPPLVALFALFARRLIAPVVAAGRSSCIALLLATFVVHNAAAGLGVLASEQGDYLRVRGEALLERGRPDDLIVTAVDHRLREYLRYAGMTRTLLIREVGAEKARQAIDATLAQGGRVMLLDDIVSPATTFPADRPTLGPQVEALARDYAGSALRHPLGETGWVYEIAPGDDDR